MVWELLYCIVLYCIVLYYMAQLSKVVKNLPANTGDVRDILHLTCV